MTIFWTVGVDDDDAQTIPRFSSEEKAIEFASLEARLSGRIAIVMRWEHGTATVIDEFRGDAS